MPSELATMIARAIKAKYSVGTSSRFCDDPPDFDPASEEELAELVDLVMKQKELAQEGR